MIEIKCLECTNCTGDSCKVYGADADKAVKSCADDSFVNYKLRMSIEEAIKWQEAFKRTYGNFLPEATEACDMAIEALKEPEIVHCNDCKLHNSCSTEDVFNFFRLENGFCAVGKVRNRNDI